MKNILNTPIRASFMIRSFIVILTLVLFGSCQPQEGKDWLLSLEEGMTELPAPEGTIEIEFDITDIQGDPAFLFEAIPQVRAIVTMQTQISVQQAQS